MMDHGTAETIDSADPEPFGPTVEKPGASPHDPYAVLKHRGYRRFLAAGMIATIGGQMQSVAVGWELFDRTKSAAALGYVGLVQFLPLLVLALPAGHAADRYRRKYQLIVAQALKLIAAIGLAWLSWSRGPVSLTYALLLLSGIGQAINMPARWAFLPELVPAPLLGNAVAWNTSGWQVAAVAGPALAGWVVDWRGGAMLAFALSALGSVLVIWLIAPIRERRTERTFEPLSIESLVAGIRFVRNSPLILATITLDLFAVLLGGATALMPIFARDILRIGPTGLGWLYAAPSIGASLMALLLAHRPPLRRAGPALLLAVAGFGVATIVFGLSRSPLLSFAMLLITGALDNISVVVRATLVQVLTPDEMRGRVSAVNALFVGSSNELGGFESGITADLFGPVVSVVAGGIGTIAVVMAILLKWPQIRRLRSLHEAGRSPQPDAN